MKKYKLAVVIGRFQPFHNGHLHLIKEAKGIADEVCIVIGSSGEGRSLKNPFSFEERKEMISKETGITNFIPAFDYLYNDDYWCNEIELSINEAYDDLHKSEIVIVGHNKDESSFYLSKFPWAVHEVSNHEGFSSTYVRDAFFDRDFDDLRLMPISGNVLDFLFTFYKSPEYRILANKNENIQEYKDSWSESPFKPIFVCTDTVVTTEDHILLIERGGKFGFGEWALPGGFLEHDQRIFDNAIKELKEETNINFQYMKHIEDFLIGSTVIDKVDRSPRGRLITHVFHFDITEGLEEGEFPEVTGDSDPDGETRKAFWLPIKELSANRHRFFSDHYSIIFHMIKDNWLKGR